jgi:hypothetical protein
MMDDSKLNLNKNDDNSFDNVGKINNDIENDKIICVENCLGENSWKVGRPRPCYVEEVEPKLYLYVFKYIENSWNIDIKSWTPKINEIWKKQNPDYAKIEDKWNQINPLWNQWKNYWILKSDGWEII